MPLGPLWKNRSIGLPPRHVGDVLREDRPPGECIDDEQEPEECLPEDGLEDDGECDPDKDSCWDPNPTQW